MPNRVRFLSMILYYSELDILVVDVSQSASFGLV